MCFRFVFLRKCLLFLCFACVYGNYFVSLRPKILCFMFFATILLFVTTLIPGQQYVLRNAGSGGYLKADGTMTTLESEASNWQVITNDTITLETCDNRDYVIYCGRNVLQLWNSGITGWRTNFQSKANTSVFHPSTTTTGAFKFSYRFGTDRRFLNVEQATNNISAAKTQGNYNDWFFEPTSHPQSFRYRLFGISRSGGNTKYKLAYLTHDVRGREVWCSGWAAIPTKSEGGELKADHVLFSTHYTMTIDSDVPSQSAMGPYDALTWDVMGNKPVMFEPDYLGYGITRGQRHPYCAPDIMAEECVDMFWAVYDLIGDLHGVDMYKACLPTYGIGYSQGGSIILACQKYVENTIPADLKRSVNWVRTCSGAGPYDPLATISQYFYQDYISMPFAAPLLVMGQVEGYPEIFGNYKAEDYFSDAFNAAHIIDILDSKSLSIDDVNALIKNTIGSMNMSDMLSDSAKNVNSHLCQCLAKSLGMANLCRDWVPEAEIWFFHNTDDDVVPYLNTISAYNQLRAAKLEATGDDSSISLYTTGVGMSHLAAAIDFMARMLLGGYK